MGKIILIRHGQTEHNVNAIYFGKLNPPLNDNGISQAELARENIMNIHYDRIYASPLQRTFQTANIVNYLEKDIIKDTRLEEIDFGLFEGLTLNEIINKYPEGYEKMKDDWDNYNYETGESPKEMYERVVSFLKTLDFNQDNLIVSHWGPINCIISHLLSHTLDFYWKFKVKNGSIIIIEGNLDFAYLTKFY